MNLGPAASTRLASPRFFARTDSVTSKTSIFRRSHLGSATPSKDSRPYRLVFMLSTRSTSQAALARWGGALAKIGSYNDFEGSERRRVKSSPPDRNLAGGKVVTRSAAGATSLSLERTCASATVDFRRTVVPVTTAPVSVEIQVVPCPSGKATKS